MGWRIIEEIKKKNGMKGVYLRKIKSITIYNSIIIGFSIAVFKDDDWIDWIYGPGKDAWESWLYNLDDFFLILWLSISE